MHKIISPSEENIKLAAEALSLGNLVVFPTETVYGLAGNAYKNESVAKIFHCKSRPLSNPLSVCYPTLEKASKDVEINKNALNLAKKFLPGSITIILKRKQNSRLSLLCSAGLDTIGIRIPSDPIALNLLSQLSFPLAAPSANKSANPSPKTAQDAFNSLKESSPDMIILDNGRCSVGIESTIIDLSSEIIKINRIGAIDPKSIAEKCGFVFDYICPKSP